MSLRSAVLAATGACLVAIVAGCAGMRAVPHPFPRPARPASPPLPAPVAVPVLPSAGETIATTALSLIGAPYRNGGTKPTGFDCSGLVRYVFSQHQIAVPRDLREQFRTGLAVALEAIAPGDLLFFDTLGAGVSHVAIAVGGSAFVHAPKPRAAVRVERMTASYWRMRFLGARRLIRPPT